MPAAKDSPKPARLAGPAMRIAVMGMGRSGTSMVAHMLHECGIYLGEKADLMPAAPDNPEGFWENLQFSALNDRVMDLVGGAWDFPPPLSADWASVGDAARADATRLVRAMDRHEPWAWKDPRNSLTWPFWSRIVPRARVIVCVRNPLEVALSLHRRNYFSYHLGLDLWYRYNESILAHTTPADRLVTHYDAYFDGAQVELRRVMAFLQVDVPPDRLARATSLASTGLRHSRFTALDLANAGVSSQLQSMYRSLCAEAGWAGAAGDSKPGGEARPRKAASGPHTSLADAPPITARKAPANAGLNRAIVDEHQLRLDRDYLAGQLDQVRAQLESQRELAAERSHMIALLESRISAGEGELRGLEQALEAHRGWLEDRDQARRELAGQLDEQVAANEQLRGKLEQQEHALHSGEVLLAQKEAAISELTNRAEGAERTNQELAARAASAEQTLQELTTRIESSELTNQELTARVESTEQTNEELNAQASAAELKNQELTARVESTEVRNQELAARLESAELMNKKLTARADVAERSYEETAARAESLQRELRELSPALTGPAASSEEEGSATAASSLRLRARKLAMRLPGVSRPPLAHLDEPSPDSTHSEHIKVRGWALATSAPVDRVEARLDDAAPVLLPLGPFRPDAARAYGRPDDTWCGFDAILSFDGMTPGPHRLTVAAIDIEGRAHVRSCRLTISAPEYVEPQTAGEIPGNAPETT